MQSKYFSVFLLTLLSMLAFAANSLLCRVALKSDAIDPASFAAIRLMSGAAMLVVVMRLRGVSPTTSGGWVPAFWLAAYAAAFSFAYVSLPAGVGALLLFGSVQATMVGTSLWRGERLSARQWLGLVVAMGGLVALLLPGLSAPPLGSAVLMMAAGVGWGAYSLHGKKSLNAGATTAGNFLRSVPFAVLLVVVRVTQLSVSSTGVAYAVCSGAITSGLGYIVWYTVLPHLRSSAAATVQLSVPLLAAIGGTLLLGEAWTQRLSWTGLAILGGIALVVVAPKRLTRV